MNSLFCWVAVTEACVFSVCPGEDSLGAHGEQSVLLVAVTEACVFSVCSREDCLGAHGEQSVLLVCSHRGLTQRRQCASGWPGVHSGLSAACRLLSGQIFPGG